MGLRAKSKWRLMVLVAAVAGTGLVLGGGYAGLKVYRARQWAQGKPLGLAAYQQGEWVTALHHLGPYLQHYPDDIEAMEAFVVVRQKLAEPDGLHLNQAMMQYRRLVALKPAALEHRRALVKLYAQLGMNTELVQEADNVLKQVLGELAQGDEPAQEELLGRLGSGARTAPGRQTQPGDDPDALAARTGALFQAQLDRHQGRESPEDLQRKYVEPVVEALKLKVVGLARLRRLEDAKALAAQLLRIAPSAEAIELDLTVRQLNQESTDAVLKRLADLSQGREQDAETQILRATLYGRFNDRDKAVAAAHAALGCARTSDQVVLALVTLLDRLELFDDAARALQEGRAKFKSESLEDEYYRRLIYQERYQQAAEELAAVDAAKRPLAAGLRAMALCEWGNQLKAAGSEAEGKKKLEEARGLLPVLEECAARWDLVAQGWHDVLALRYFSEKPRDRDLIEACGSAVARDGANPFFHECLGNAYLASGDSTAALPEWDAARTLAPSWAQPLARESRYYAGTGNPAQAYLMATQADKRMPNQKATLEAIVISWRGALGTPGVGGAEELLAYLAGHKAQLATDEATVPLEVALLAALKKTDEAGARVRELIAAAPAEDARALLAAAVAAHDAKLPAALAADCLAQYERLKGVTPDLAAARCRLLLQDALDAEAGGRKADAEASRARAKAEFAREKAAYEPKAGAEAEGWDIAWCQLLEVLKDAGAHDAWKALVNARTDNARVQWAAAEAGSVRGDHLLMGQVLAWLAQIDGEKGLTWRLEKGQWLLEDKAVRDALEQAVKFTTQTVAASPESVPARVLLARAYSASGNMANAVTELSRAADMAPQDLDLKLDLAQLYEQQKDLVRAGEQLKRVAAAPGASPAQKTRAGILLARAGDSDLAINMLGQGGGAAAELLPGLYWQKGDLAKALEGYQRLLAGQPSLEIVEQALSFFAATGRDADAQEALKVLEKTDAPEALRRAVRGSYLATMKKTDAAVAELEASLKLDPKNGKVWRKLIATDLMDGRAAAAVKAAGDAAGALPDDPACAALGTVGPAALQDQEVGGYLTACLLFPEQNRGLADVVQVLRAGEKDAGKLANQLALVAARNPDAVALQVLTIRKLMVAGKLDDALAMARRAMLNDTSAVQPALLATLCLVEEGKWEEALGTARKWKALAQGSADADLMIAASYLRLARASDAVQALQPYIDAKQAGNPSYRALVLLFAAAQLQQGQIADAEKLLWPIVQQDKSWREDWTILATEDIARDHQSDAERWIRKLAEATPADDLEGQMIVAVAWDRAARNFNSRDARDESLRVAERTVAQGTGDQEMRARAAVVLGTMREAQSDPKSAEAFYRRALELNPKLHQASNNLAVLLAKNPVVYDAQGRRDEAATQARLAEAQTRAREALAGAPQAATYYDTMALALRAAKQYDEALASLDQAIALEPRNPEWLISSAETQMAAGHPDKARAALARVDELRPDFAAIPDLKKRYDLVKEALAPKTP